MNKDRWNNLDKSARFAPTKESMDRLNQYNPYSKYRIQTTEDILNKIDIKEIERYLRKKKLENLKGE